MNASNAALNWAYNLYAVDAEEIWRRLVHCSTNYMIIEMDAKKCICEKLGLLEIEGQVGFLIEIYLRLLLTQRAVFHSLPYQCNNIFDRENIAMKQGDLSPVFTRINK